jgi:hypothetical protein
MRGSGRASPTDADGPFGRKRITQHAQSVSAGKCASTEEEDQYEQRQLSATQEAP